MTVFFRSTPFLTRHCSQKGIVNLTAQINQYTDESDMQSVL